MHILAKKNELMKINRRRAPSSAVSQKKKIDGHLNEKQVEKLIGGQVIEGSQKADLEGEIGKSSIKSGKKWQILLYSYGTISNKKYLKILKPCLDAFTENYNDFTTDRTKCIYYKENYLKKHGKEKTKLLSNEEINKILGNNKYVDAKRSLAKATPDVSNKLKDKIYLKKFLSEAIFNLEEVSFLIIKDSTYKKDNSQNIFTKEYVLETLCSEITPAISKAGNAPQDYNVPGQKTLLRYMKDNGKTKNIAEIEVRTDSEEKYRYIRFNMYSRDVLYLLLGRNNNLSSKKIAENFIAYEDAIKCF
jgi:hypothetical protein